MLPWFQRGTKRMLIGMELDDDKALRQSNTNINVTEAENYK